MIVGLAGYAGAGKDTAAQCLVARGWRHDSFAATLKAMALACNPIVYAQNQTLLTPFAIYRLRDLVESRGWDEVKRMFPEVREFLQRLGTDAVRSHLGADVWVDALMSRWFEEGCDEVVITDVRFPNEANMISEHYPHRLIWIDRPGTGPVNDHASDQGLVPFATPSQL